VIFGYILAQVENYININFKFSLTTLRVIDHYLLLILRVFTKHFIIVIMVLIKVDKTLK